MHTKDILAAELARAGLTEMAERAAEGYYHDYLSPLPMPSKQLADDLARLHTTEARALLRRHLAGEFDASREESDEWAASREGREAFGKFRGSAERASNRAERRAAGERSAPRERLGDKPIEPEYIELMNQTASALDELFNGELKHPNKTTGFVLMVFKFGEGGRCNYVSNAARTDVITLLKEQLARFEGMPEQTGHA
jgi:hypothetical protein